MVCVPDGIHHIDAIYGFVEEYHKDLIDEDEVCTTGWNDSPEWKHKVRNALQTLKGKGRVHKTGLEKGFWRIQVHLNGKVLADLCSGHRSIWWDKEHPDCIYMDIREEEPGTIKLQPNWCVKPDVIGDYRDMFFLDETFHLIVWDIPHILEATSGIMLKKYGKLGSQWRKDCTDGFKEVWRVLKPHGVLLFKYNDLSIAIPEMLSCFFETPLVGTRTKKSVGNDGTGTYWFAFIKLPKGEIKKDKNYELNLHVHKATRGLTNKFKETINELETRIEMLEWYEDAWHIQNPSGNGEGEFIC